MSGDIEVITIDGSSLAKHLLGVLDEHAKCVQDAEVIEFKIHDREVKPARIVSRPSLARTSLLSTFFSGERGYKTGKRYGEHTDPCDCQAAMKAQEKRQRKAVRAFHEAQMRESRKLWALDTLRFEGNQHYKKYPH